MAVDVPGAPGRALSSGIASATQGVPGSRRDPGTSSEGPASGGGRKRPVDRITADQGERWVMVETRLRHVVPLGAGSAHRDGLRERHIGTRWRRRGLGATGASHDGPGVVAPTARSDAACLPLGGTTRRARRDRGALPRRDVPGPRREPVPGPDRRLAVDVRDGRRHGVVLHREALPRRRLPARSGERPHRGIRQRLRPGLSGARRRHLRGLGRRRLHTLRPRRAVPAGAGRHPQPRCP